MSDSRLFAMIHSHLLPRLQQEEVEVGYSIVSVWSTLVQYSKSNQPVARRLVDFLLSIVAVELVVAVATVSKGRPALRIQIHLVRPWIFFLLKPTHIDCCCKKNTKNM